jgi:hypothetical protein
MDLQSIPPDLRLEYIDTGRSYGSLKVRDQAHKAEKAYEEFGVLLAPYGFKRKHMDAISGLAVQYPQGIDDRAFIVLVKQESSAALGLAMHKGKAARLGTKSQLDAALLEPGLTAKDRLNVASAQEDTAALTSERPDALTQHLSRLIAGVAAASAVLDAQEAATATATLQAAISQIQAAQKAAVADRSTSPETEHLDLIDGAIIARLRLANKAAKAAAKALGQPAIAKAFSLKGLR